MALGSSQVRSICFDSVRQILDDLWDVLKGAAMSGLNLPKDQQASLDLAFNLFILMYQLRNFSNESVLVQASFPSPVPPQPRTPSPVRVTDGGWGLTDGGWRVTDGGWRVTDGDWGVTDGSWRVTDGGWGIADGGCGVEGNRRPLGTGGPCAHGVRAYDCLYASARPVPRCRCACRGLSVLRRRPVLLPGPIRLPVPLPLPHAHRHLHSTSQALEGCRGYDYFRTLLGVVEIARGDTLERIYFHIPSICRNLTEEQKQHILYGLDRSSLIAKVRAKGREPHRVSGKERLNSLHHI